MECLRIISGSDHFVVFDTKKPEQVFIPLLNAWHLLRLMKLRILQVIPYFTPAWYYGGPVAVAYNISKELVKRGHEVTVYTTDTLDTKNRIKCKEETIDGIKVKRFRNLSGSLIHHYNIFLSLGMLYGIKKDLNDFDIIHMHEYRTIQNVIVHHYAKKHGIPYVFQVHGAIPKIAAKQRLKYVYDTIWGHKLLKDALKVIALTETEVEQYKSVGLSKDKIEVVPNGVDLAEFESLPERGEFRSKYGLGSDEKVILYLGRIHKTKGIDLLVKVFASLTKEMDSVRLAIVGPDGGYLSALIKLTTDMGVSDKVVFTGPIYERNKLEAYVDADVFVTPSFYGFPVTFVEACACGIPIITTQAGHKLNWLDGQAGFVVSHSEEHLNNAIWHMLSSEKMPYLNRLCWTIFVVARKSYSVDEGSFRLS